MKSAINQLVLITVLMLSTQTVQANQEIEIVTAPWQPYVYEEDNKVTGTDVDIVLAIFKKMGITANIRLIPWNRSLSSVKALKADAILSASISEERKTFLYFPSEPVSKGVTVFFKKAESPISSINLNNPENVKVGAMLGYEYCDELDNSKLIKKASRVQKLEQNFNMLLQGRIDLVVDVELVGFHEAQKMGISDQVTVLPNNRYCSGGNYLAFAKKPGYEKLASAFSSELTKFKTTDEYKQILEKYGKNQ